MVSLRKIGGLWHWRLGRIGGSFYVVRPRRTIRHRVTTSIVPGMIVAVPNYETNPFWLIARCERICRARKPAYMPNRTAMWGIV